MQEKRETLFIQVLIKSFICIIYAFPFVWVRVSVILQLIKANSHAYDHEDS